MRNNFFAPNLILEFIKLTIKQYNSTKQINIYDKETLTGEQTDQSLAFAHLIDYYFINANLEEIHNISNLLKEENNGKSFLDEFRKLVNLFVTIPI